jgi:hypothetical protein
LRDDVGGGEHECYLLNVTINKLHNCTNEHLTSHREKRDAGAENTLWIGARVSFIDRSETLMYTMLAHLCRNTGDVSTSVEEAAERPNDASRRGNDGIFKTGNQHTRREKRVVGLAFHEKRVPLTILRE